MNNKLNLEFVLVPAGEFIMGSNPSEDRLAQTDEIPQHRLFVSDFYIMKYPVTNAQYRLFVEATGHRPPRFWPNGEYPEKLADHPVVGVSFRDTIEFCRWASEQTGQKLRLPTEAEWEKAARGDDGRIFPWGNEWEEGRCNHAGKWLPSESTPVDAFSPQGDSPYGVADMAGNAQEWCISLFGRYPYDPQDGREILIQYPDRQTLMPRLHETGCVANPQQIEAALDKQCIRGGSRRQRQQNSRCAYRSWAAPMHRSDDTGFRCCFEPDD